VDDPGKLRHRASIVAPATTQGGLGQETVTAWSPIADATRIPVRVTELAGRELYTARQLQADVTMEVKLRWREGVTSKMRVTWHDRDADRTLLILGPPINRDGKKRWMFLLCKEAQ
jgi:SPP1 family predicted phage head-tail adaptor